MSCLKTWSSLEKLRWAHFEILTKKFSEILILIKMVWLIQEIDKFLLSNLDFYVSFLKIRYYEYFLATIAVSMAISARFILRMM